MRDVCVCDWLKDHTWPCINSVHVPASNRYLSIFGNIFVSPELCSERDYVITHSVHSMYVVCSLYVCVCMYVVCGILQNWSLIHIHWCIHMGLGDNDPWVESHMWPKQTWGQRSSRGHWFGSSFWKKGHCIHILWYIFMGLGHNDPWAKSHMWPQQTWGQRSSRGQWPLIQGFFEKRSLYPHTLTYFLGTRIQWSLGSITHVASIEVGSNVILGSLTFCLTAKVCDCESRRDSWFENRLVRNRYDCF